VAATVPVDDPTYDLSPGEAPTAPTVVQRDYMGPPRGKTRKARAREIEELKTEGLTYLHRIQLLLWVLGVLMLIYNVAVYKGIEETVANFQAVMLNSTRVRMELTEVERIASNLKIALTSECGVFIALGLAFCGLAFLIEMAPIAVTWGSLATYGAVWILDLILVENFLGSFAAGLAVFNLGTLIKLGIIAGLWYGVRVGHAYDDQIIRPLRELEREQQSTS
jgi:hypothetical protein